MMLDAPLMRDLHFAPTGFVGYWILKKDAPHFIQHRVSKIEYIALYGRNLSIATKAPRHKGPVLRLVMHSQRRRMKPQAKKEE
jgi:hypothetical protein